MANPNFNPNYSSNEIWHGTDMERCITDDLDTMESDIAALETGKSDTDHTHSYNDLTDKPTALTVDSELSDTSTNPVQNKVVAAAIPTESESYVTCTAVLSGSLIAKRYGKVVTLCSTNLNAGSTRVTSGGNLCTLPEEYWPGSPSVFVVGNGAWMATISISSVGVVSLSFISGQINAYMNALFTVTYVTL